MIEIQEVINPISYTKIAEVVNCAFASVNKDGVVFGISRLDGEKLQSLIERKKGKCFIALDGDLIVGTATVVHKELNTWYKKGDSLRLRYVAVLPEYAGRHIGTELIRECVKFAQDEKIDLLNLSTPVNNARAKLMYERMGFIKVRQWFNKDHYVIDYVYRLNPRQLLQVNCMMHYWFSMCMCRFSNLIQRCKKQ